MDIDALRQALNYVTMRDCTAQNWHEYRAMRAALFAALDELQRLREKASEVYTVQRQREGE